MPIRAADRRRRSVPMAGSWPSLGDGSPAFAPLPSGDGQ